MSDRAYTAHIELCQNGQNVVLYFNRLTKRQAEALYSALENGYSHVTSSAELVRYGWEGEIGETA